uniref:SKP1-like protein n=1 Tax=Setaria italica TaxID=4555 RepID=K3Y3G1_SETIT
MAEESGAAMITLISFDNTRFETMRRLIEEGGGRAGVHNGIPLPQVDATTLAKVIEYCNKHAFVAVPNAAAVVVDVDKQRLPPCKGFAGAHRQGDCRFDQGQAAGGGEVMGLMELACRAINDLVRDRPVEEVRWVLGIIDNGFTVEEEEEIRRENAWAFE